MFEEFLKFLFETFQFKLFHIPQIHSDITIPRDKLETALQYNFYFSSISHLSCCNFHLCASVQQILVIFIF